MKKRIFSILLAASLLVPNMSVSAVETSKAAESVEQTQALDSTETLTMTVSPDVVPEETVTPEKTETPVPETAPSISPEASAVPEQTAVPEATETPAAVETPAVTEAPEDVTAPEESKTPEGTTVPEETAIPTAIPTAFPEEEDFSGEEASEDDMEVVYGVGPAYRELVSEEEVRASFEEEDLVKATGRAVTLSSDEAVINYIKEQMKARNTWFAISLTYSWGHTVDDLIDFAMDESRAVGSDEGDYILANYYESRIKYRTDLKYFEFTMTYQSTAAQEAQVTSAVQNALASLNLGSKSGSEKIKAIHDYIVNHIEYDQSLSHYSTYDAIIGRSVVCQGYASLFYRMCKEAGIPVRFVPGVGYNGESLEAHAWNIVKLGNYWYNVDTTWDDPIGGSPNYNYFLKSDADFEDHIRADKYNTESFYRQYPMAALSYGEKVDKLNIDNSAYDYTFDGIDGGTLSTQSNGKPKILVFYGDLCVNSKSTLRGISQSDWVKEGKVDVYAVQVSQNGIRPTQQSGKDFRDTYCPEGYIKFGYSEADYGVTDSALWDYADLIEAGGQVILPVVVMIDANNKVQLVTTGYQSPTKFQSTYLPLLLGEQGTSPFLDVKPGSWMEKDINFVYEKGIMNGVGNGDNFAPEDKLTRSMFATVLYRIAGEPPVSYRNVFNDVLAGQWYSKAVVWAYDAGIVNGKGGGNYGPDDNITREQVATMLLRFAEKNGYPADARADLNSFRDQAIVNSWAREGFRWAVGTGIINGVPGNGGYSLNPQGSASRAECAVMLGRFIRG